MEQSDGYTCDQKINKGVGSVHGMGVHVYYS